MARRTSGTAHLRVDGITELNQSLKKIEGMEKELRKTNKKVADIVRDDARGAARSLGSTPAHVAPSLKSSAGALFGGVSIGGPGYEMALGAEFGSDKYKQFKPWRGSGDGAGYFLWPTIRRDADKIFIEYSKGIDELLRRADLV